MNTLHYKSSLNVVALFVLAFIGGGFLFVGRNDIFASATIDVYSEQFKPTHLAQQFLALDNWLVENLPERNSAQFGSILSLIKGQLMKQTNGNRQRNRNLSMVGDLLIQLDRVLKNKRCSHKDFELLRHLYYGVYAQNGSINDLNASATDDQETPFVSYLEKALRRPLEDYLAKCSRESYDESLAMALRTELDESDRVELASFEHKFKFGPMGILLATNKENIDINYHRLTSSQNQQQQQQLINDESMKSLYKFIGNSLKNNEFSHEAYEHFIGRQCRLFVNSYENVFDIHSKLALLSKDHSELAFIRSKSPLYKSILYQYHFCDEILARSEEILQKLVQLGNK